MISKINFYLLLAVGILFSSCDKDQDLPQTDYSIESTLAFELISKHENGWIKEARYNSGANRPSEEFEYYENGNIKSAKIYASYPQQHLYMEVSRSEDNKPLWSKYYTPGGELWFETNYENGLPAIKKVYSDKGTSVHTYTNGELSKIEFTATGNNSIATTTYNVDDETRNVNVTMNGESVFDEVYPYEDNLGAGIYTNNHMPVGNAFSSSESSYLRLNQSFFQSPNWLHDADPSALMYPYRLYDEFYSPGNYFATRFTVSTELYQSVIEQYPVTEDEVLVLNYKEVEGTDRFTPPYEEKLALDEEREQDPALFELKYGNQYVYKKHYGKIIFIIGALRNMPTNDKAASEIKNIAQRRMDEIVNEKENLSTEEFAILDKVWFEMRFFSTLKEHRNGVVLNSSGDYKEALEKVLNSESSVIQMEYRSFDN